MCVWYMGLNSAGSSPEEYCTWPLAIIGMPPSVNSPAYSILHYSISLGHLPSEYEIKPVFMALYCVFTSSVLTVKPEQRLFVSISLNCNLGLRKYVFYSIIFY